ncbi:MAG: single-stranded-DNA-specific exonuclease RecJ [Candidatus Eremiobacteraeota bacterium]|nr:single-stranded-DNA-specific exonuclease RecJ [Candidatus Eremiobacteraeota bacterium]
MSFYKLYPRNLEAEERLINELGISRILARLLINRGIIEPEEVRIFQEGNLSDLQSPWDMKGMKSAVSRIRDVIRESGSILVHGDYDVDGMTGTALLVEFLRSIGIKTEYYIPHRGEEGYGISIRGLEKGKEMNASLVLTVDCGCGSPSEVEVAREMGMSVVITDHHMVEGDFPGEAIVINPRQPGCGYRFKELAGVGVAYRLICALSDELGTKTKPETFLDLVAIGSVGDVVPLISENRILVKEGLSRMNKHLRPGLEALFIRSGLKREHLTSRDISFIIAPRLNSAGRLKWADLSVELLMASPDRADMLAEKLENLNHQRQQIEEKIRRDITEMIRRKPELLDDNFLLVASQEWHPGIIGLSASRLAETLKVPVFVIAFQEDGTGRGSARARSEPEIFEVLQKCSSILDSYGGHPRAGGFQIKKENLPAFKENLKKIYAHTASKKPEKILLEAELSPSDINDKLYSDLKSLEPFGEGNPEPGFLLRGVRWDRLELVGNGQHIRGYITNGNKNIKVLAFGQSARINEIKSSDIYNLAFTIARDNWQDINRLYLKIKHFKPAIPMAEKGCLIDARGTCEKITYIRHVASKSYKSVILVRILSQADYLRAVLGRYRDIEVSRKDTGKPGKAGTIFIHSYRDLPDDLVADNVILLYPPPSLKHFHHPIYRDSPKIHLLFGEEETLWVERFQSVIFPTETDLRKIFATLSENFGNKKFSHSEFLKLQQSIREDNIRNATMEVAIRVFKEIGIIEQCGNEKYNIVNKDSWELKNSPTFNSFISQRKDFNEVKKVLPPGGSLPEVWENILG